jgi:AcrR family transcriptional regulator
MIMSESSKESESTSSPVTDRRIRKTRAALKQSLTELLKSKNIKDISVKELTDLADVNRGTFYLHYKDVFDLLEQSENDLLEEFKTTLDSYNTDLVQGNPVIMMEGVYKLCRSNANLVSILIGENGDIKFLNKLNTVIREKCLNDWSFILKKQKLEHFDAYYSFLVGGCLSLLQYWFSNGMKQSPKELATITGTFLERNL